MKKTIIIIIIIFVSIGLGYAYEQVSTALEKRAHPILYSEFVEKYSQEYSVPQYIIYSVIKVESSFRSDVESDRNAIGLMQITPDTFEWLMTKTKEDLPVKLLYDPETNIKYGTFFLQYLYAEFENWDTSFAAYNAGRGAVNGWLKNPQYAVGNQLIIENIPFPETKDYIRKVNNNKEMYKKLYFSGK